MKFSINNIKSAINKTNIKTVAECLGYALAVEMLPAVVQTVAGKDANGQPKVDMAGAVPDAVAGGVGVAVALGFGRKDLAGAVIFAKGMKAVHNHVNPSIAKALGTPILPAVKSDVVKVAGTSDMYSSTGVEPFADNLPAGTSYRTIALPDGTTTQVLVENSQGMSDMYSSTNGEPFADMYSSTATEPFSDEVSTVNQPEKFFDMYSSTNTIPFSDRMLESAIQMGALN